MVAIARLASAIGCPVDSTTFVPVATVLFAQTYHRSTPVIVELIREDNGMADLLFTSVRAWDVTRAVRGEAFYWAVCSVCGAPPDADGSECQPTPQKALDFALATDWLVIGADVAICSNCVEATP